MWCLFIIIGVVFSACFMVDHPSNDDDDEPVSVIGNPGFGMIEDGIVTGWQSRDILVERGQREEGVVLFKWHDDAFLRDVGSVSIELPSGCEAKAPWPRWFQNITLEEGQSFAIEIGVKTENIESGSGAYASLEYYDTDGTRIAYKNSREFHTGTNDWTTITIEHTVPQNTARIELQLLLSGTGKVWFDYVELAIY